ncbi:MAG: hypothetical protein H6741_17935 [Alphaproteobacteria bacterium]|nr:hypothetical protein [Alphaproteobacteria bacterium]
MPGGDEPATEALAQAFLGRVLRAPEALPAELSGHTLYACGDLSAPRLEGVELLAVEGHFSGPLPPGARVVPPGALPRSVQGLGALYPRLFPQERMFSRIRGEHAFQQLTESSKPSHALRTGIYLSEVRPAAEGSEALRFHLMRCSSNLTGPTDNLRETDRQILGALNALAAGLFAREVSLNHVLAQIYSNARAPGGKARKARIGAHSDKTKDMHPDGVMAFCSFYEEEALARLSPAPDDPFDRVKGRASGLARLVFKRKQGVEDPALPEALSVPLYPGSVLFIPLSTNRLYTHEIRPSNLDIEDAPTRMGYVVRCSGCEAEHREGRTFLREGEDWVPLEPMQAPGAKALRSWYFQENTRDEAVDYGPVRFSMNAGDYMRPLL